VRQWSPWLVGVLLRCKNHIDVGDVGFDMDELVVEEGSKQSVGTQSRVRRLEQYERGKDPGCRGRGQQRGEVVLVF
jgi:hypothetical protein